MHFHTHLRSPSFLVMSLALATAAALSPRAPAQDSTAPVDFATDIRPLLSDKCFQCHGPDEQAREAELRLDMRDQASRVLQADADGTSELLRRVMSADEDVRMPPPSSKNELSADQIDLLRRWLSQGAPFQSHWSFTPIVVPPLPQLSSAAAAWGRSPIDAFVRRRLDELDASPSPPAPRAQWLRRVTFDVTGLPPTINELREFLADDRPDAAERVVDRLLASPRYGERMAADWLDVARYSDTFGYQVDRDRFVWPWRDWVIASFNNNLPFDQFLTEQLAGDLLPQADQAQVLATTFNRLHPQKVEGGSVPEEFRVEYVADRSHTFASAFLGLTLECCRCHDHKYDPLTQREYYQLFAFFNNIDEAGLYSYFTNSTPTPTLMLTEPPVDQRLRELAEAIQLAEQDLQVVQSDQLAGFKRWLHERPPQPWVSNRLEWLDFESGAVGANRTTPGKVGQAVELTGDDAIGLSVGNFPRWRPFSIALWLKTPDHKERAVVFHRSRAWTDAGSRGYELLIEDGRLSTALIHFWPGNAIAIRTRQPLPIDEWTHVVMTYDGSSRADGLSLYLDGDLADVSVVRDHLYKNITGGGGDNLAIGERFRDRGFAGGQVDEFQVFDRCLTSLEAAQIAFPGSLPRAVAQHAAAEHAAAESAAAAPPSSGGGDPLLQYYLHTTDPVFQRKLAALQQLRQQRCRLQDGVTEIMVMQEMPQPRDTRVLLRGAYDAPGEPVQASTPSALPPFPASAPRNRLGLAQWLTSDQQPLTARVAVNRLWSLCFGRGLVATPEDFGSQGAAPSHPQLLDWLASDFMRHGWNVKRTLRQILLSATYQQSSTPIAEEQRAAWIQWVAQDPQNRWLTRGPSHQLPAEMLRDNALAVSGLLALRIGGPPARPYELAASFKPVAPDSGEGLYRRSLYTYWKRTAPAPVMMTLDAAKRDVCSVRRERTASPLQSLVLLNDPQMIEASRVLAESLVRRHGRQVSPLINEAFLRLASREPTEREFAVLAQLWKSQSQYFREHPGQAEQLLSNGQAPRDASLASAHNDAELAAATVLVSTLLNYDACVTKR